MTFEVFFVSLQHFCSNSTFDPVDSVGTGPVTMYTLELVLRIGEEKRSVIKKH